MIPLDTIICGDCLEEMKKLPDGCIDMILCDLPYGTTENHWDTIIPFHLLWEQYRRIAKKKHRDGFYCSAAICHRFDKFCA